MTQIFTDHLDRLIRLQRAAHLRDIPCASIRQNRLLRAAAMLVDSVDAIAAAVSEDFGNRSVDETKFETFGAVAALRNAAGHVESWMAPTEHAPLAPDAKAWVEHVPLGVVGVIGPWNYPIMTVFGPLAGIIAAGNRAILKPSEFTPRTNELLHKLIAERFEPTEIALVEGGAAEAAIFAAAPFDHLIFTGSASVARHVMAAAASNLTPVTLELGGKSPVVVEDGYDLGEAASRLMAVKLRSAGQICLAPDYALVPAGSERAFAEHCVAAGRRMYPEGLASTDYTSIINDAHYARLKRLVDDARARSGEVINIFTPGRALRARSMMPAVILHTQQDMLAMQDEIFGPVLPIVGYENIDDAIAKIRTGTAPLALYYFGTDEHRIRRVLNGTASGGVTINDVMTHMYVDDLPFGGIGQSGTGAYRGETGFRNFSHARAIYRQTDMQDMVTLFHPPYSDQYRAFVSAALAGAT